MHYIILRKDNKFLSKKVFFQLFILFYLQLVVPLQPMRYLLTVIMAIVGTAVYAQFRIDGRPVLYDSNTNTMLATIPQADFNKNNLYKVEVNEGWSNLKINGMTVTGNFYFINIKPSKQYPITIRNKDQYVITSNIVFTFLPIMHISGEFGYEYKEGTVSLYSPDGEAKDTLSAVLKWRGGTTNTDDKHKRNYKIKFTEDQQFFGLRKDNNWILDAGQADLFRLRNRIATELWNDMATKPYYADQEPETLSGVRGRVVELFLNKEYRGIYCLTECMDRKEMKLKKVDKKTGEIRGCLYKSGGYGSSLMSTLPATYDNKSETWDTFEVKYPEMDDAEETDWSTLWNAINFVANSSNDDFRQHIAEYFDIPVVIDYYIFINVLNACDNVGKNMYWAVYDKTKDKKLTPAVWDLDLTVGSKMLEKYLYGTTGAHSPEYQLLTQINLTKRLSELNVDNFNEKVITRYNELRKTILSSDQMITRYANYFDALDFSGAAQREMDLWSGDSDVNNEEINFEYEIYYISYWLSRHLQYLDENMFKPIDYPTDHIITVNNSSEQPRAVYNIRGQKISNSLSLQKGIYIVDGKKYIVR